jgi:hypothetical protein
MLSFEELTEARRSLQSFCLHHVPSLTGLQSGISFKLLPSETKDLDDGKLHHPTTTATCLSSIFDCPPRYRVGDLTRAEAARAKFSQAAYRRPGWDWTSEGSAGVYCRCRALPTVISLSTGFHKSIKGHLNEILGQLQKRPERFGIGEAAAALPEDEWYPPNAFHTYWTLEILRSLRAKYETEYDQLSDPEILDLKPKLDGMLLWAKQQLGTQLGLHSAAPQSSVLDSDQLAWSLAIFLRFDKTLSMNLENRDFLKQALKCLFSTQTDGTWRHYKPLFHYLKAGNAYCYVFETFAALLQCALDEKPEAEMIRELLKPYDKNLMSLWEYADSTKIPIPSKPGGKEVGWCSGHRTNVTEPESWATASVFSYTQALRNLIGIWCREEALANRKTPRTRSTPKKAASDIVDRGETWGANETPVSERLWTMFVNPVQMHECKDRLEPDSQPIDTEQARSAILFGPPGTSKTTLIRALADLIEWDYIEIHASHFVAEGLPEVQKTADTIFKQISELDHTVVLFDEIDELVRERDMEKDAFGRFLTTSMLPKLAELWEARKILYFVATNHISYFDSAIIRSHRFDALVLVSPPSYGAKLKGLVRLLSDVYKLPGCHFEIEESSIQSDLEAIEQAAPNRFTQPEESADWRESELNHDYALAKFALLRYDELNELAHRLARILTATPRAPVKINETLLKEALIEIDDSEWRKNKSYVDYLRDRRSERRDYQMLNVWKVQNSDEASAAQVVLSNGSKWLGGTADSLKDMKIPGFDLVPLPPGGVEIRPSIKQKLPRGGKKKKKRTRHHT